MDTGSRLLVEGVASSVIPLRRYCGKNACGSKVRSARTIAVAA